MNEFKINFPDDDKVDLSKSDKELFEESLSHDEKAISLFNTWNQKENLYEHPGLCFSWQLFKMYIKTTRTIHFIKNKFGDSNEQ